MVLLNALVNDIGFEALRLIFLIVCMVCGIFVGKKLKDAKVSKKSANENNGN